MKETFCACVAAACWLFVGCAANQDSTFLAPGPGSWIVYPSPPRVPPLAGTPMTTVVFRRDFTLPNTPTTATLSCRFFKTGQLSLNGSTVADGNSTAQFDVARYLHSGTNEIEVRVTCGGGLPALSLNLDADGFLLKSDEAWESSLAGAIWQPARFASNPPDPAPGNWIYGAEDIQGALRASWPLISVFAVLAALGVAAQARWSRLWRATFILLAALWGLLFLHNIPLLPAMSGFDASAHLAYIQFIQEHKSLPSASCRVGNVSGAALL